MYRKSEGTHAWLKAHDRIWLDANLPPCKVRNHWSDKDRERGQQSLVRRKYKLTNREREELDRAFAEAVKTRALDIMNTSGPPQKVTLRKLRQEIPGFTASLRHNAYWPLTEQALEEVLESTEHFAIRRIQWAAQQYLLLEERKPLSKKKLVQKAGVYGYRHQPMIQATIQEAMRKLAFLT